MRISRFIFFFFAFALSGCTTPPTLDPLNRLSVPTLVHHINCEIRSAVQGKSILNKWFVKYDLTLQVDENGAITPSATTIRPYHSTAGTINIGAGFNLSGTATRTETITVKASIAELKKLKNCQMDKQDSSSRVDIAGDLGIKTWLEGILPRPREGKRLAILADTPKSMTGKPAADAIGHTVQFVLVAGANVTPTFLLEKFKGPVAGSGSFASVSRTDTNKLVIAFGNTDPNTLFGAIPYDRLLNLQQLQLVPQLNNLPNR